MKNISSALASLLTTAWIGSLWAVGYLAVPVLFYAQPDRQLAGMLAGQMFTLVGYLGMVCGLYLLVQRISMSGRASFRQALVLDSSGDVADHDVAAVRYSAGHDRPQAACVTS